MLIQVQNNLNPDCGSSTLQWLTIYCTLSTVDHTQQALLLCKLCSSQWGLPHWNRDCSAVAAMLVDCSLISVTFLILSPSHSEAPNPKGISIGYKPCVTERYHTLKAPPPPPKKEKDEKELIISILVNWKMFSPRQDFFHFFVCGYLYFFTKCSYICVHKPKRGESSFTLDGWSFVLFFQIHI